MSRKITRRAIATPPGVLTAAELPRTIGEIVATRVLRRSLNKLPAGDGHGVLVIPGFLSDDFFSAPLLAHLNRLGYNAIGWSQGTNLGPGKVQVESVAELVSQFADRSGDKISIVGHSLGGIYAREIAKLVPDVVRQTITMGSPFAVEQEPSNFAGKWFRRFNPDLEQLKQTYQYAAPPPQPTSAIYTRLDGVVGWGLSVQQDGHAHCENIEVRGSHCGLIHNASVWYVLADRLSQQCGQWQPFSREGWRELVYPTAFAG